MTYYKAQIACIYGIDRRTLTKRVATTKLLTALPKFKNHKAVFNDSDLETIKEHIGTPENFERCNKWNFPSLNNLTC